ncbi:MAG TPA: SRPBCC family protein [Rhodocyclaceae bacterium]
MTTSAHDPSLDLAFQRLVDVPPEPLWEAWTQPKRLMPWFCPAPWMVTACEIDLRPGGIFRTVMRSAEGQEFVNLGCYLELVPNRRLAWTNVMSSGFRPVPAAALENFFRFTAIVGFEPQAGGTLYSARALHGTREDRDKHAAMGFEEGWGKALDQLLRFIKG